MPNLRGSELLILVLLIVLLFGAKRLPDAARGIGRSLRIFKAETKGLTDSDDPPPSAALDQAAVNRGRTDQARTDQAHNDEARNDQARNDQGPASADRTSGIDATGQAPAGHEIPKPPTNPA